MPEARSDVKAAGMSPGRAARKRGDGLIGQKPRDFCNGVLCGGCCRGGCAGRRRRRGAVYGGSGQRTIDLICQRGIGVLPLTRFLRDPPKQIRFRRLGPLYFLADAGEQVSISGGDTPGEARHLVIDGCDRRVDGVDRCGAGDRIGDGGKGHGAPMHHRPIVA